MSRSKDDPAWQAADLKLVGNALAAVVRDMDTLALRKRRPNAKSLLRFYDDLLGPDIGVYEWQVIGRSLLEALSAKDWRAPLRTCVDTLRKRITTNEERIERLTKEAHEQDAELRRQLGSPDKDAT